MRILNRQAQRYLIRLDRAELIVGIPGPDLQASADWSIEEAAEPGTYHVVATASGGRSLRIEDGLLVFDTGAPVGSKRRGWKLEAVGDGSGYQFIVDARNTGLLLGGAGDGESVVLQTQRDRAAMWLLQPDCVADARSVHLRYDTPPELTIFYNEVYPEEAPPGTFFCTSGFGGSVAAAPAGYAGIQMLGDGSRIAIFSVWHRGAVGLGSLATTVAAHPEARQTSFSGEGSGSSMRLPLQWQTTPNVPVRFVVTAEPLGGDTVITAYVGSGGEPWIHLGAILRAETGGRLMSNPYAFIEDFARSGNAAGIASADRSPYLLRSARFANPWIGRAARPVTPVVQVKMTAYSPHPLENLSAAVLPEPGFAVALATGSAMAKADPAIGATFADPMRHDRSVPDLDGIPYY